MSKRKKGYYQTGGSSKLHDRRVRASKPGKRRSAGGSVYYERRKNRSDMPGSLTGPKRKTMAVKLKKYPKRPKASASTLSMEKYLDNVRAIDKENNKRLSLAGQIAKVGGRKKSKKSAAPAKRRRKKR